MSEGANHGCCRDEEAWTQRRLPGADRFALHKGEDIVHEQIAAATHWVLNQRAGVCLTIIQLDTDLHG